MFIAVDSLLVFNKKYTIFLFSNEIGVKCVYWEIFLDEIIANQNQSFFSNDHIGANKN